MQASQAQERAAEARVAALLALRLDAEAALVASSLPAALAWAVSGCAAAARRAGVRAAGRLRVVLPLAHLTRLEGARIDRLVALGGAAVRPVGTVLDCPTDELERALEGAAAGLLVVGAGAPEVVAPADFLWCCRLAGRPALLLDPASGRWAAWADGGAALTVADGRAVAGIPAGILAGTEEAIAACRAVEEAAAALGAPEATRAALAAALEAGSAPMAPRGARPDR